ncbi:hypothetical protein SAMN04487949_1719 [Halogranum gelatinilyticum]|uniref:Uncharacterized protein n=1 Tax=Halogranum gelatinilyticum TaxID=660521 RepID=A0A1G9TCK8_9EURY|nr:hypothetical protein [Halogranum gelatinilyticum]SDM45479.1 hypothetical protein SAMN04487949_1719 [Halogranum gelatinilyticum]
MRVRDWTDILRDVTESSGDPEDWRAVAGQRRGGVGEDLYLGHPSVGVFQLKTYAKNPYDVKGVGARVARKVDGDIDPLLPKRDDSTGRFAVQGRPENEDQAKSMAKRLEETVRVHAEAPTTGEDFFTDVMEALDSPAFGPMEFELSERPDRLDDLSSTFEEAEELLSAELDDLIEEDEVGRGFY